MDKNGNAVLTSRHLQIGLLKCSHEARLPELDQVDPIILLMYMYIRRLEQYLSLIHPKSIKGTMGSRSVIDMFQGTKNFK